MRRTLPLLLFIPFIAVTLHAQPNKDRKLDAETAKVITSYRVYAKKVPTKDGDYTMDHTALIYLMDRDGRFVSPFNLKRTPEEAAVDLKRYL